MIIVASSFLVYSDYLEKERFIMYPEQIFFSIVLLFFLCLLFVIIKEKWGIVDDD